MIIEMVIAGVGVITLFALLGLVLVLMERRVAFACVYSRVVVKWRPIWFGQPCVCRGYEAVAGVPHHVRLRP